LGNSWKHTEILTVLKVLGCCYSAVLSLESLETWKTEQAPTCKTANAGRGQSTGWLGLWGCRPIVDFGRIHVPYQHCTSSGGRGSFQLVPGREMQRERKREEESEVDGGGVPECGVQRRERAPQAGGKRKCSLTR